MYIRDFPHVQRVTESGSELSSSELDCDLLLFICFLPLPLPFFLPSAIQSYYLYTNFIYFISNLLIFSFFFYIQCNNFKLFLSLTQLEQRDGDNEQEV